MEEKFLPIGSIVELQKKTDNPKYKERIFYCIVGYLQYDRAKNKLFDYSAVFYPFGLAKKNERVCFNHENIKQIVHVGFKNVVFNALNESLNEKIKNKTKEEIIEEILKGNK